MDVRGFRYFLDLVMVSLFWYVFFVLHDFVFIHVHRLYDKRPRYEQAGS